MAPLIFLVLALTLALPLASCKLSESDAPEGTRDGDVDGIRTAGARVLGFPLRTWPRASDPGGWIVYPDTDGDGQTFNCGSAGRPFPGHRGTDFKITWNDFASGIEVLAAAAGTVRYVFDGKTDNCTGDGVAKDNAGKSVAEPDCRRPDPAALAKTAATSGGYATEGVSHCITSAFSDTAKDASLTDGFCFSGGNLVVVYHENLHGIAATVYENLRKGSIKVKVGDKIAKGTVLGQVGASGATEGPQLHFEVWPKPFATPLDPWSGRCGPNTDNFLWEKFPPWS